MKWLKVVRRLLRLSPPGLGLHIVPWVSQLEEIGWLFHIPTSKAMEGS
jgi:hypothetical protein